MNTISRKDQIINLLESDPENSFLLFAMAKEYEKGDEWDEAKEVYHKLLNVDASYIGLYYHYGKLLEYLEDKTLALEIYQKGINKSLELNDLHARSELQSALMNLKSDL
jgi:tetratricopeptide (TPR) repeat protein